MQKFRTRKEDSPLQLPRRTDDTETVQKTPNPIDFRTSLAKTLRGSSQPDPGIRHPTVRYDHSPRTSG